MCDESESTDVPVDCPTAVALSGGRGGRPVVYRHNGDADKLDGLSNLTLATWVKFEATPSLYDRLLSDHSSSSDGNDGFDLFFEFVDGTSGRLRLSIDSSGPGDSDWFSVASGTWLFIAATWDGGTGDDDGAVNYYLGTDTSSVADIGSGSYKAASMTGNTVPFRVGDTDRSSSDRTPDALFDNVRVYDNVLSQSDLENLRVADVPEPSSMVLLLGLVAMCLLGQWRRKRKQAACV